MGILDQPPEEFEYVDYRPALNQSAFRLGTLIGARTKRLMKKPMKAPKVPKGKPPKVPPKPAHLRVKGGGKVGKKGGSTAVNQPAFGQRGGEDLPMYSRGAGPAPAYSPKVPPSRVKPGIPGKSPAAVTAAQGKPPGYSPPVPKKSAYAQASGQRIVAAKPKQGSLKRAGGVDNLSEGALKRSGGVSNLRQGPAVTPRAKPTVPGKSPAAIRAEKLKAAVGTKKPSSKLTRSGGVENLTKAPPVPQSRVKPTVPGKSPVAIRKEKLKNAVGTKKLLKRFQESQARMMAKGREVDRLLKKK